VVIGVLEVSFLNDLVMEHFLNQNLQVEPSILLGIPAARDPKPHTVNMAVRTLAVERGLGWERWALAREMLMLSYWAPLLRKHALTHPYLPPHCLWLCIIQSFLSPFLITEQRTRKWDRDCSSRFGAGDCD
jgi:hypothetical protein